MKKGGHPSRERNLRVRAEMLRLIRSFFYDRDYLEVDTPIRGPAPIPEAHIDLVESENCCLYASPEIYMKQLLAQGFERIVQIARVFRKGERGGRHLPEFTMLEWYTQGQTYENLMDDQEGLVLFLACELGLGTCLNYQGQTVDLTPPWDRLTVRDAFERHGSMGLDQALETGRFDEIMGIEIEPRLGLAKPVFLLDYPRPMASLARLKEGDASVAERVELYINGLELSNGFSELDDPDEQRRRFHEERSLREWLGKPNYHLPEAFLASLRYMPPAAGIALGIDRLAMLFCDTTLIDDVVSFIPGE